MLAVRGELMPSSDSANIFSAPSRRSGKAIREVDASPRPATASFLLKMGPKKFVVFVHQWQQSDLQTVSARRGSRRLGDR
jgi:hypothetical protein